MMTPSDMELLERYSKEGSEEAFSELVHRYLDMVYSAAVRQVHSPQLAEEVAQSVFTDLSRSAGRMKPDTVLTAWLYQVTRRTAVDVVRRESRRQLREQLAVELTDMNAHPSLWSQIEPLLEEAMENLDPVERTAILLRYFDQRSLREVGQTLGTSEDAAQKRVSRAVERLREFFSQRGVTVGASALALALSANAVQSAPLGLVTAISSGASASGAALHSFTTIGATKALAMTTVQKIIITAALMGAAGVGLYQNHQASLAREQLRAARQNQDPLKEQLSQLTQERDEAATQLAALREENETLRGSLADLPKLRGEVVRSREASRELAQLKALSATNGTDPALDEAFKTWAVRATRLRQRLDQAPDQQIPELRFLSEQHWFDSVKNLKQLDTDKDFNEAFSTARNLAKSEFGQMLRKALRGYTDANNGQLPQDLSQLKPFFDQPVDDAVLQRYKLLQSGALNAVPADEYLVADIAPLIDENRDAVYRFSMNGTSSQSGNPIEEVVKDAGIQFAQAHDGLLPTDASQLAPYLKQPLPPEKVQQVLSKIPPGITTLQQLQAVMH
jgi:RNA polymerase sigma factor (sigma-70 family)